MIIDELFEAPQLCPECGGISFSNLILAEKKDACYHKVKASAKVWPSAYASGRLVQCRKKGAANYGNKSEGVAEGKITLSTDPNWYGATVDNYQASGPVVNIPANQLVGFEPDDKMNQPKSKVNVEKIVAGLKQGSKLPPLLVRKYKNGYQVLDGHHRFWAYKLLGIKSIPAQIVPDSDIEEISKQGVAEASDQSNAISQEQLNQMYANAKPMMFIKNTPVALVPLAKINQIGTPQQVQQVQQALGSVDQTSYTDEYKNKGYVVFQWNGTALDLYVASPEVVSQKYVRFNGQLPQDEKSRGKIPSLIALSKLGIDPSKVPFFVKKVPNEMVSAKQLGLEGKTIQVFWGSDPSTQEVAPGGFLTKNEHGMIYTIAPDAQGLPIGYLPAQQGVAEGYVPINISKMPTDPAPEPKKVEPKHKYVDNQADHEQYRQAREKVMYNVVGKFDRKVLNPEPIKGLTAAEEFMKQNGLSRANADLESISTLRFHATGVDASGKRVVSEPLLSMKDVRNFYNQHGINPVASTTDLTTTDDGSVTEGEQQPGADYRDPKEVDYDDEYDAMVARVKKLAGLGPLKTVYDPNKRVYRNMPTAVQPKK